MCFFHSTMLLYLIACSIFNLVASQGLELCGNELCVKASDISVKITSTCELFPRSELCTRDPKQLAQRLPEALQISEKLKSECEPLCPGGQIDPNDPNCIPPGCEKLPMFGREQAEEFMPQLREDGTFSNDNGNDIPMTKKQKRKYKKKMQNRPVPKELEQEFGHLFKWENLGGKKCCTTYRRTIPIQWPLSYGDADQFIAHPVYCPVAGGYQWIDLIRCGQGKCKTKCRKAITQRTFFVTNVKPHPYWGHCFQFWLPVWFMKIKVRTHCYCQPKIVG